MRLGTLIAGQGKGLICVMILLLSNGCGVFFESDLDVYPTVLLYDQYLTEAEAGSISTQLSSHGFAVRRLEIEVPAGIHNPTIVHSLLIESHKIDLVEGTLSDLGYDDIRVASGNTENHIYRGYNLGVYIPEIRRQTQSDSGLPAPTAVSDQHPEFLQRQESSL